MEPPAPPDRRPLTAVAIVVSLALHAAGMLGLRCSGGGDGGATRPEPSFVVDIELAPPPPKAEALPPEQEREDLGAAAPADPADEVQVPPVAEPAVAGFGLDAGVDAAEVAMVDAGVDAVEVAMVDAGVDAVEVAAADAGVDATRVARADAGVDAEALAVIDAGVDAVQVATADGGGGDGGLVAVGDGGLDGGGVAVGALDGGAIALGGDAGLDAASTAALRDDGVRPTSDGGVPGRVAGGTGVRDAGLLDGAAIATGGADPSGAPGARPSAGTASDLRNFFPGGHVVSVLIRLDRLRDTEWSPRVDAIFAPMPDYRALVGGADVKLADTFDTLAISTPAPRDASATTLVVRARVAAPALRDLLDAPDAPVAWAPVVGGALGRRGRSPRVWAGDRRVFLQWRPGWTTLAAPGDLGGLLAPRAGALDVEAPPTARPAWLTAVESIEDESGHPTGPALMATAAGFFPASIPLPIGDARLPGPDRATVTLELVAQGFLVRGNVRFADEGAAATAADTLERVRKEVLGDRWLKIALGRMGAANALQGLSIQRTGRRLAFATSISTADARVLLLLIANLVDTYFASVRAPAPQAPQAPQAPAPRP